MLIILSQVSAPEVTANVRNVWLDECAVRAKRKKLKYILMVMTLVARNANEAIVAPMVWSGGVC
jgi:hypothetical protein